MNRAIVKTLHQVTSEIVEKIDMKPSMLSLIPEYYDVESYIIMTLMQMILFYFLHQFVLFSVGQFSFGEETDREETGKYRYIFLGTSSRVGVPEFLRSYKLDVASLMNEVEYKNLNILIEEAHRFGIHFEVLKKRAKFHEDLFHYISFTENPPSHINQKFNCNESKQIMEKVLGFQYIMSVKIPYDAESFLSLENKSLAIDYISFNEAEATFFKNVVITRTLDSLYWEHFILGEDDDFYNDFEN
ncbi:hypothetical protein [Carp edema virus]|nr:hypothetical protein [Carp edema virus]